MKTKSNTRKNSRSVLGNRISSFRASPKIVAGVCAIAVAVVGTATILFSSAASQPVTGAYVGAASGESEANLNAFAKYNLNKSNADLAEEFLNGSTWATMEGNTWPLDAWGDSAYAKKMVIGVPMLPADGSGTMPQGAQGAYNAHYKKLGENLVKYGMDNAILRIGWEFNGNWYRWSAVNNGTQSFVDYWNQIVTTMKAVPGNHFKFNWNPTNGNTQLETDKAYPGDATVDYIGVDLYNGSWNPNNTTPQARWNEILVGSPNDKYGKYSLQYWIDFAKQHNKPLSLPEWGTGDRPDGHGGGDDPYFIQKVYEIVSNPANNVAFNVYWDYAAPDYNASLDDHPKAAAAFRATFGAGSTSAPTTPPPAPPTPAPTVALTATSPITAGGTATLTWNSTNATGCTASSVPAGWTGAQPISGSANVKPTVNTTYSVTCSGAGGSGSKSTVVTVNPSTPTTPVPVVTLGANPNSIVSGNKTTLTWNSTNATSCTASGNTGAWSGSKAVKGSQDISPTATAAYTLLCTGNGGKSSATVNVTVTPKQTTPPPPPPSNPVTPARIVVTPVPSGSNNRVNGTVTLSIPADVQAGATKVQYYVDGSLKYTTSKPSSTFKYDTRRLRDGGHTFSVKITNGTTVKYGTKDVTVSNKSSIFRRAWNNVRY